MKKIKLNKNKFALVDNEDFEFLSRWKWYVSRNNHFPFTEYAKRNRHLDDNSKEIFMHRVILEMHGQLNHKKLVDHINHDGLDNRKSNLRPATMSENKTYGKKYSNNTSGYKGVYFEENGKPRKWRSRIAVNGRDTHIGWFYTKEEAAIAYNQASKKYYGNFSYLNKI